MGAAMLPCKDVKVEDETAIGLYRIGLMGSCVCQTLSNSYKYKQQYKLEKWKTNK